MTDLDKDGNETQISITDLTVRDWFAAQALVGLIASDSARTSDDYAGDAYCIADAMMQERTR